MDGMQSLFKQKYILAKMQEWLEDIVEDGIGRWSRSGFWYMHLDSDVQLRTLTRPSRELHCGKLICMKAAPSWAPIQRQ